jgi:hypothetical protein
MIPFKGMMFNTDIKSPRRKFRNAICKPRLDWARFPVK